MWSYNNKIYSMIRKLRHLHHNLSEQMRKIFATDFLVFQIIDFRFSFALLEGWREDFRGIQGKIGQLQRNSDGIRRVASCLDVGSAGGEGDG